MHNSLCSVEKSSFSKSARNLKKGICTLLTYNRRITDHLRFCTQDKAIPIKLYFGETDKNKSLKQQMRDILSVCFDCVPNAKLHRYAIATRPRGAFESK